FSTGFIGPPANVFVVDVATGSLHNLTRGRGNNSLGSWSPDGHSLVISRAKTASGTHALWIVRRDGSGWRKLLVQLAGGDIGNADWSPDGRRLAFAYAPVSGGDGIFVADIDGTHPHRLTSGSSNDDPRWSAD